MFLKFSKYSKYLSYFLPSNPYLKVLAIVGFVGSILKFICACFAWIVARRRYLLPYMTEDKKELLLAWYNQQLKKEGKVSNVDAFLASNREALLARLQFKKWEASLPEIDVKEVKPLSDLSKKPRSKGFIEDGVRYVFRQIRYWDRYYFRSSPVAKRKEDLNRTFKKARHKDLVLAFQLWKKIFEEDQERNFEHSSLTKGAYKNSFMNGSSNPASSVPSASSDVEPDASKPVDEPQSFEPIECKAPEPEAPEILHILQGDQIFEVQTATGEVLSVRHISEAMKPFEDQQEPSSETPVQEEVSITGKTEDSIPRPVAPAGVSVTIPPRPF